MKVLTFRDRLMSETNFAISYIVNNNKEAVADRLRGMDYSIESDDDIFEALDELAQHRKWSDINNALSVPMRTQGVDPAQLIVVKDVAGGYKQAAGAAKAGPFNDLDNDNSAAAGSSVDEGDDDGTDWTNVFGTLITGITTIWASTGEQQTVQDTPTQTDAALAAQQEKDRKAKLTRNILIGVGVVVAIVLLVVFWKKFK